MTTKLPSSQLTKVISALRKHSRRLSSEERSGIILAALVRDQTQGLFKNTSVATNVFTREIKRNVESSKAVENSLASLLLFSRIESAPQSNVVLARTAGSLLTSGNDLSNEAIWWGLSLVQSDLQKQDEIWQVCDHLLTNGRTILSDHRNAKSLLAMMANLPAEMLDRQLVFSKILPSVSSIGEDRETTESLLTILHKLKVNGEKDDVIWKLASKHVEFPLARQMMVQAMKVKPLGVRDEEYSDIVRRILSSVEFTGVSHEEDLQMIRTWVSSGVLLDLDVMVEICKRSIVQATSAEQADIITRLLSHSDASSSRKAELLKQLLEWALPHEKQVDITAQRFSHSTDLIPILQKELIAIISSESESDSKTAASILKFVLAKSKSNARYAKLLGDIVVPAVLDSTIGRELGIAPKASLNEWISYTERTIFDNVRFLISNHDLSRELNDLEKVLDMRLRLAAGDFVPEQYETILGELYQHPAADEDTLEKVGSILQSLPIKAPHLSSTAGDKSGKVTTDKVTVLEPMETTTKLLSSLSALTTSSTVMSPHQSTDELSLQDLRFAEWNFLVLAKHRSLLPLLKDHVNPAQARDLYVRARLVGHHPAFASRVCSNALTDVVHTVFPLVESETKEFNQCLDWMLSDPVLNWHTSSAPLHASVIAGLIKSRVKFNDTTVAKKMCEFMNRAVLSADSDTGSQALMKGNAKEHALFVIAKACQFLQADAVEFEEGCAERADSLMEWFCSDSQSGLFSSLCKVIESSTKKEDDLSVLTALSAIRDCLVMEYLSPEAVRKPLYESMRKRLANLIVITSERFQMDTEDGYLAVLLAGLSACSSFQAIEPNALWSEAGTRIPLLAAQYLKVKERSTPLTGFGPVVPTASVEEKPNFSAPTLPNYENHSLSDSAALNGGEEVHEGDEPVEVSSTVVPWIIHCGLVASSFKSVSLPSIKRKDALSFASKDHIGNALLMFLNLKVVRDHPEKTLIPCVNALASFAGRTNLDWTRIDTKVVLKTLRLAESDKGINDASLAILREYAKRPALGKVRPGGSGSSASSSSNHAGKKGISKNSSKRGDPHHHAPSASKGATNPIIDRAIDAVLRAFSLENKTIDALTALNGFRTISGILENANSNDIPQYQLRLYEKGFVALSVRCLLPCIVKGNNEDVLEAACVALQNMFAFQPKITREICRAYVESMPDNNAAMGVKSPNDIVHMLVYLLFDTRLRQNSKLATAVIGAYFALVQADPDASLSVTKLNRGRLPMLAALIELREIHSSDPVLRETAEALLEFLRKQYIYSQKGS